MLTFVHFWLIQGLVIKWRSYWWNINMLTYNLTVDQILICPTLWRNYKRWRANTTSMTKPTSIYLVSCCVPIYRHTYSSACQYNACTDIKINDVWHTYIHPHVSIMCTDIKINDVWHTYIHPHVSIMCTDLKINDVWHTYIHPHVSIMCTDIKINDVWHTYINPHFSIMCTEQNSALCISILLRSLSQILFLIYMVFSPCIYFETSWLSNIKYEWSYHL